MITTGLIKARIDSFLVEMLDKKLAERNKELDAYLAKNLSESDQPIIDTRAKINALKRYYSYENWVTNVATKMVGEVTIATHISKGINSVSRGDSVFFRNEDAMPAHLVGSHNTPSAVLDVSGNAASLPVYNFINLVIEGSITIRSLLEANSEALMHAFSDDEYTAFKTFKTLKGLFLQDLSSPATSAHNKQLLFPLNGDDIYTTSLRKLRYINVVPLYPSVFCYEVRNKIQTIKFSETNKIPLNEAAALNAEEPNTVMYQRIPNLAVLKIGGSKPANISKVVVMSGGETLLLPTLPPKVVQASDFALPKDAVSLFHTSQLNEYTRHEFSDFITAYIRSDQQPSLKSLVQKTKSLHILIATIVDLAIELQGRGADWLDDYNLQEYEKVWLDPKCTLLDRNADQWRTIILDSFVGYLTYELEARLPTKFAGKIDNQFCKTLRNEVVLVIRKYKNEGVEVFV